jgi:hypothetical protein
MSTTEDKNPTQQTSTSGGTNQYNISPVISPDILGVISTSTAIKTFGAQTKDSNKQKTIVGDQSATATIQDRREELNQREKQAGINKNNTIAKAQDDYNTGQIDLEKRNFIESHAEFNYGVETKAIELERKKLEQDEQNIKNNPDDKIKEQQKKQNAEIKKSKTNISKKISISKKDLTKQVLSNAKKSIVPVITLELSNKLLTLLSERKKLAELVDQVNNYIDTQVKDQATVVIATNLRNNASALITNNINKLKDIADIINSINKFLKIFALVLTVISLIPFPLPYKPVDLLLKATAIIGGLSVILSIITSLLANEIEKLNELRDKLKQVSLKLDIKTLESLTNGQQILASGSGAGTGANGIGGTGGGAGAGGGAGIGIGGNQFNLSGAGSNIFNNTVDQQLSNLSNTFLPLGGDYPPYKGFIFKIKEENNPKFVVRGNKRRYAAAIDKYGVEILKSEYSFTLDPQDLVDQLKLIIDQQNLQG